MSRLVCHACGAPTLLSEPVPRAAECEKCHADLRSCRNCRHWNVRYNNECTETEADPVADKARRNFCEYFYYSREGFTGAPGGGADRAAEARAQLEALFRRKPAAPDADD